MLAVYVLTLCLMAVSHSAPLTCEDMVRPLDQVDRHHLEGSWNTVAGGQSDASYLEKFKSRDSGRVVFANASETSDVLFTRIVGFNGSCQYLHSNVTLQGSSFILREMNFTATFLQTSCPDCLVLRVDNDLKMILRSYLLSRRREVEQNEMEEFKAQVECLNLLPPVIKDPTKELCPEKSSTEEQTEA